jgi:hypothetical protein
MAEMILTNPVVSNDPCEDLKDKRHMKRKKEAA